MKKKRGLEFWLSVICLIFSVLLGGYYVWWWVNNLIKNSDAPVLGEGDVVVFMQQGIFGGDSDDSVQAQPGDRLYYVISVENKGDRNLVGTVVLPCPVLSETDVYVSDGGLADGNEIRWKTGPTGLAAQSTAYFTAVMTLPETVSVTGWTMQAQVQCEGALQEMPVYLSDNAVSVAFGSSAVGYRLDGSLLSVWNDESASGGASGIQVHIPVREGEAVFPDEWQVEDGQVVISVGGLVPGGSKKIDLSGVIDRLDVDHIVITSD